eukprot:CAMPEP_0184486532 /NCGR_PEP_ID=MMETSP0113_2-20130426/8013_1 /TAXON_ID=91329 /ORGANISM="Norrisiella sphaerica, Strain BC52" /LENGTH=388 /DNA_ID=CAMNT_0026868453 /DNA_START=160 /DNA_END=1323 /DNA_ORIENTATION=+
MSACCGACLAVCCCRICGTINASSKYARIPYAVLFFLAILLAVVLRNNQSSFGFTVFGDVELEDCGSDCRSDQAVYRVCLALTLFFAAHVFILLPIPPAVAYDIHSAYFGVKILLLIPLLVSMFFIDARNMEQFAEASRVFSIIFLVIQAMAIIDTSYRMHYWMIDKENQNWDIFNLVLSFGLFVASLIAVSMMFAWFTEGGPCEIEKFILSTVVIVPFFYTIASITEVVSHGSLFVSSVITAYAVYIAFGAMISNPSQTCNSFANTEREPDAWQIILGVVFIAISITYIAYNMGENSSKLFGRHDDDESRGDVELKQTTELEAKTEQEGSKQEEKSEEELRNAKINAVLFHLIMTLASMYTCMLLTQWSSLDYSDRESRYLSGESFW